MQMTIMQYDAKPLGTLLKEVLFFGLSAQKTDVGLAWKREDWPCGVVTQTELGTFGIFEFFQ